MNSKYKVLASNTLVFAIGNILIKLIAFFLMPLYTSVLTKEQYGVAELLNNSIEIVLPIATLCIIEALYRFSIDKDVDHSTLFANSFFVILIGDIFVGIISAIWFSVFGYEYALHFWLLFVTTTFYKLVCQFARGLKQVKRYAVYGVLNSLLLVVSNIILLVWLKGDVAAYLLSFSIGYGVTGFAAFIISKEYKYVRPGHINFKKLKEMFKYSMPSIPNMLSWWVNSLSDRYIILLFGGAGLAGLYTAASKLPAMINLVTSIFQQAWQYSTATEIDSQDRKTFFSDIFRGYSYLCVLVCCGLLIVNKAICKFLLQADFYSSWKFVPLLLLAATFGCISTYYGTFYNALKNNKMLMFSTIIGAFGNVVLNFILIPKLGGFGAAIATVVSYLAIMVIRMIDIRKVIELEISYKRFVIQFGLLIVAALAGCFEGAISVIVPILCFLIILFTDYHMIMIGVGYLGRIIRSIRKK